MKKKVYLTLHDIGIKSSKKIKTQNNVFNKKIKNNMYWLYYDNNSGWYDSFLLFFYFVKSI